MLEWFGIGESVKLCLYKYFLKKQKTRKQNYFESRIFIIASQKVQKYDFGAETLAKGYN